MNQAENFNDALQYLTGEVIVGGNVDSEGKGIHLYTQSGLILIFEGSFGIFKTEETKLH